MKKKGRITMFDKIKQEAVQQVQSQLANITGQVQTDIQNKVETAKREVANVVSSLNTMSNNARSVETRLKESLNTAERRLDVIKNNIEDVGKKAVEETQQITKDIINLASEQSTQFTKLIEEQQNTIVELGDKINDNVQQIKKIGTDTISDVQEKAKQVAEVQVEKIMCDFVEKNALRLVLLMIKGLLTFWKKRNASTNRCRSTNINS